MVVGLDAAPDQASSGRRTFPVGDARDPSNSMKSTSAAPRTADESAVPSP